MRWAVVSALVLFPLAALATSERPPVEPVRSETSKKLVFPDDGRAPKEPAKSDPKQTSDPKNSEPQNIPVHTSPPMGPIVIHGSGDIPIRVL